MASDSGNPVPALRISQLDARELDDELLGLMKSQLLKALKFHKTGYISLLDPEITAALKLVIWRLSSYITGATVGQQLLGVKYRDIHSNQWMTRRQKILMGVILIGCPWLQERLDVILSLVGAQKFIEQVSQFVGRLELLSKILGLLNFLVFLRRGCYATLTERTLGIRPYFPEPQSLRQVSFELMTRELLWHGFSEFLIFLLPLVNYQRMKNFIHRHIASAGSRDCGMERTTAEMTQCAVCGEWPMNPQEIGCCHVFCYYCVQSNHLADRGFSCGLCGQTIPSSEQIRPVNLRVIKR